MDALIRWMIALSWTAAGISSSFVMYTHHIDWERFNESMARMDSRERMGFTAETKMDLESKEKQLEYRELYRNRWADYHRRTEPAKQHGILLWSIATALSTLNAIGLIVIHKKGFNPVTKASGSQTLLQPTP